MTNSIRPAEVSHHLSGCGDNGTVRELPQSDDEVVRQPEKNKVGQHLLSMTVQRNVLALRWATFTMIRRFRQLKNETIEAVAVK